MKIVKDDENIRWYFIEYISNRCDVNDLKRSDLEDAIFNCSFVIAIPDNWAWELFMQAGQDIAQP